MQSGVRSVAATARQVLQRASPESQGIASHAILQFIEALERQHPEIHSVMLLRHGSVIAEGWWSPYAAEHPHMLFSLSKSFTSTAVGLALAEGRFSIDDPVLAFFPQDAPTEPNDMLAAMRVRHLLSMTTGHAIDAWSQMDRQPDANWIKRFFSVPVEHPPGTHFLYNTGASYMLAAIVQQVTGMKLVDYLAPRLFQPLGITNATWQESPQGIALGGIGLSMTTEDVARFGQLYLQLGLWQGEQILPETWVEAATAAQGPASEGGQSDWFQGYGYQFWRCRHGAFRGDGVFGQFCVVMPDQDAVVVMTAGIDIFDSQGPLDLVWDILLPAMGADPLPDDPAAQAALTSKLANLALPPVRGRASSPIASRISGRTYALDANELNIRALTLSVAESGCTLTVQTATEEHIIACGHGHWQHGHTSLFDSQWVSGRTPIATSGAWTADDTYTMIARLYETPFYHSLVFTFDGDELLVESRINVSLDAVEPLLLTGKRAD
ncbi:MAG: serine hydrolase [Anaerolineae bacterium]|nr:serine hydrolase [Anaerolineae bacterium]